MKNLKKLTLLHSNDMRGDFLAEKIDDDLVGGVSLLSGDIGARHCYTKEHNTYIALAFPPMDHTKRFRAHIIYMESDPPSLSRCRCQ